MAGEVNEFSDEGLRVNKIVDYSSYYGIVFGDGQMAENDFQKCLDEYVLVHKAGISKTVEDKTSPMKVRMLLTLLTSHTLGTHLNVPTNTAFDP